MKKFFKTLCMCVALFLCFGKFDEAKAAKDVQYPGLCCQVYWLEDCHHPAGIIFLKAVWVPNQQICD